jgi:hypothetical protein
MCRCVCMCACECTRHIARHASARQVLGTQHAVL